MDLREAITTRRSIRKYQDRDVPTELILQAIGLAGWAPNGGNFQPWKFFVVKNRALITRIADTVQAKQDVVMEWPEAAEFMTDVQRHSHNASFFRHAPAIIAIGMGAYQTASDRILIRRGDSDPVAAEMIRNRAEIASRTQTVSGATATLLLALHSLGLGACWMAGPMLARRELEQMLEVPGGIELFALVPVGYPDEAPAPGPRKPLEEIVRVIE